MLTLRIISQILGRSKKLYVMATDIQGYYIFTNNYFHEIFGYSPESLLGQSFEQTIYLEDHIKFEDTLQYCLADKGNSYRAELRILTQEGLLRWTQWEFQCLLNPEEETTGILCIGSDLTELKSEQEKNEVILSSITDVFFTLDKDWIITSWNRAAEKMMELDAADVIGRRHDELRTRDAPLPFNTEYTWAVTEHQSVYFEGFYPPTRKWYAVHAYPSAIGLSVLLRDITDHKKQTDRSQQYLEAAPDVMVITDAKGNIRFANKLLTSVFGYLKEEIIGKTLSALIPVSTDYLEQFFASSQTLSSTRLELMGIRKDGISFPVEINLNLAETEDGMDIIAAIRDISERRELEKKATLTLLAKEKLISETSARAQKMEREELARELHDNVNQQLATAALLTESVLKSHDSQAESLKLITETLHNAVKDIRTLSKSLLPFSLEDKSLTEILHNLQASINKTGVLEFVLETDSYHEPVHNPDLQLVLLRTIQELLTNTLKHARASFFKIHLSSIADAVVELRVSDDGIGFHNHQYSTGIGLRNIHSRLELLNASMQIESSTGKGSLFTIRIPPCGGEQSVAPVNQSENTTRDD